MHYQYYEGVICITYEGLVPRIINSKGTYDSLRGRKQLEVLRPGKGLGNPALIKFDSLPALYRQLAIKEYGDPAEVMANKPISDRVVYDVKADEYYRRYELGDGGRLPDGIIKGGKYNPDEDYVKRYATAASWLNMLASLVDDKKAVKKELNMSMGQFWETLKKVIDEHNTHVKNHGGIKLELPTNRIRLQEKIAQYKDKGYEVLISGKFCNDNRVKVKDEVAEALLLEMISHPHQHDDTIIMQKYNLWAEQNGRPVIKSATTVGNYRRQNGWKVTYGREGKKQNYDTFGRSIKRKRPSAPLLLVNSDDNDLDLFFHDEYLDNDGKLKHNYFKRYTLMIVADSYNDYILGYAIGEAQTTELVMAAYLNAVMHVKELTGSWYLPHQINTDRWGLDKNLTNRLARFYQSLATFTPALTGNARSKYIERSFGTEWHQVLKGFDNYAGHNITAKEQTNRDNIQEIKKAFPGTHEAPAVVAEFINRMRHSKDRQAKWLEAFHASDKSQERMVGDEQMLMLFGTPHVPKNQYGSNSITNEGVVITIQGVEYTYEVPEALYLENVGKKVQVIYDPGDLSRVLVTDGAKLRFVAYEQGVMPSALADYQPGDRTRLNAALELKQRDMQRQLEEANKRQRTLQAGGVDAQSVLKAGILTKGIKQAATQQYLTESIENRAFQPKGKQQDEPVKLPPATGNADTGRRNAGFNPYDQM